MIELAVLQKRNLRGELRIRTHVQCVGLGMLFFILTITTALAAPQTGKVAYPTLGIEFTIPDGWLGQESEQGFLMGSNTEPGFILLSTHTHKHLDAIKREASRGISDGVSMQLQMTGEFNPLSQQAVAAEFSGIVEGQQARAYIAGVINPHGLGVTVMALTSSQQYSARYAELVGQIVSSLKFSKPETGPVVEEWRQTLQGAKLTYMDSYYSSGPSYNGNMTGGGYSTEIVILLCRNGRFSDSRNSSLSIDSGGAFGGSAGSDQGSGSWNVIGNASGGATLQLNYNDGSLAEYVLEYKDKKTLLNGTRYFRTYDAGC